MMRRALEVIAAVASMLAVAAPASAAGPGGRWVAAPASAAGPAGRWVVQPTPQVSKLSRLAGVSCPSAGNCTAVGTYYNVSKQDATLAEHWDGSTWTKQPTPGLPSGYEAFLTSVSCVPTGACLAVGGYTLAGERSYPLADARDGSTWSQLPAPATPPGGLADSVSLDAVSCPVAGNCIVVGQYVRTASRRLVTLAESWDGSNWAILPTPNPVQAHDASLAAVSCVSATSCTAVGYSITPSEGTQGLAEQWNGTGWKIQRVPAVPGGIVYLDGVSCTGTSACMAVGVQSQSSGGDIPIAEHRRGGKWSTLAPPAPTTDSHLVSVWCTHASYCTAVGVYATSRFYTLAERWNGQAWAVQKTPETGSELTSVDCVPSVSSGGCTAVGSRGNFTLAEIRKV